MRINTLGPSLIGIAALLWSADSVLRSTTVRAIDPTLIVFLDHVIGLVILLAWGIYKFRTRLFSLGSREWMTAAFIGAGGSAVATVLFTTSFRYANPTVVVLLQKLQPVLAVALAYVFLGERPRSRFVVCGAIALFSAVILVFPDLDFRFNFHQESSYLKGVAYALLAAALWGASTVGGKVLLKKAPCEVAVFWRYAFGVLTLLALLLLQPGGAGWSQLSAPGAGANVIGLALLTGVAPLLLYYRGLSRTPASVAAFVELLYPIGAVVLNLIFLNATLAPVQLAAGGVLILAVIGLCI